MINTAYGQISVCEAVQNVREKPTQIQNILAIMRQLQDQYGWEARFVSRYVLAHPDRYDAKILRLAQEITSRILLGRRKCKTADDLWAFIGNFAQGTVLKLTLKQSMARQAAMTMLDLVDQHGMIFLTDDQRALMMAVCLSGEWGFSQNNVVTVTIMAEFKRARFIERIARIVDATEVLSVPEHAPDAYEEECRTILHEHAEMWFEPSIFAAICDEEGFALEKERAIYLSAEPDMTEVLDLFWSTREQCIFLRAYAEAFKAATGG